MELVFDYSKFKIFFLVEVSLVEVLVDYEQVIFVSGCFWCIEEVFECVKGVKVVYFGYVGGIDFNFIYWEVSLGYIDYVEVVVVYYDLEVVIYNLLLEFFYVSYDFI